MTTTETTTTRTKWISDPMHSTIGFSIRHMMMTTVRGEFEKYNIQVETIGEDFMTASVLFVAETESVTTRSADRDKHLRSDDFFNAEQFPVINFKATKFESVDNDGSYEMYGDLTIRDITKSIKLDVEFGGIIKDPWGNAKAGFSIHGKINRKDFNLKWNAALESGGVLVSEDVKIECEVQLIELR